MLKRSKIHWKCFIHSMAMAHCLILREKVKSHEKIGIMSHLEYIGNTLAPFGVRQHFLGFSHLPLSFSKFVFLFEDTQIQKHTHTHTHVKTNGPMIGMLLITFF